MTTSCAPAHVHARCRRRTPPTQPPARALAALVALALAPAAACSGDDATSGVTNTEGPAGGRPAAIGAALISSDRVSTTVSLLPLGGAATAVARDACFGTASAPAQLTATLSGDVVLPSQPQPGNELALIDRKNGVITWVDPAGCTPSRQLNVGPGWASNPQDLVGGLGSGKGYVTRYGRNPLQPDEGHDILIIDAARGEPRGRIALGPWAPPATTPGKTILPFPARAVAVGTRVYVALNNLSEAFDDAGLGRVVVVDAVGDTVVAAIELPGLKNCGGITTWKRGDGSDGLAVACGGAYSDGDQQIDHAGVALVDLTTSPPAVTVVPSRGFGRPLSGFELAVAGADEAFTVVNGDGMQVNDAVWAFDLAGGAPRKLVDGPGSYLLSVAGDRERGVLYVLDASPSAPRIQLWSKQGAEMAMTMTGAFPGSPSTGLPPRQLAFY